MLDEMLSEEGVVSPGLLSVDRQVKHDHDPHKSVPRKFHAAPGFGVTENSQRLSRSQSISYPSLEANCTQNDYKSELLDRRDREFLAFPD